jgi:hypothetical protein
MRFENNEERKDDHIEKAKHDPNAIEMVSK